MPKSNQLISAPSISLFAFQQKREFFAKNSFKPISPAWLTLKYCQILNNFYVYQKIKLDFRQYSSNLINQPQKFSGTIKTKENLELIAGEAYPGSIDDNAIISLRINGLEQNTRQSMSISKLADFNPKDCFSPHNVNTNLGQTVVISTLVNNPRENPQHESLKSLANNCVSSFYHLPNSSPKVTLIDSRVILNGYIFTYHLAEDSCPYNQVQVCLFFRQEDKDNFEKHHRQLANFLLSLHKLTYVHQHSRSLLKLVCYQLDQLEYNLQTAIINNRSHQVSLSNYNKIENKYIPIFA